MAVSARLTGTIELLGSRSLRYRVDTDRVGITFPREGTLLTVCCVAPGRAAFTVDRTTHKQGVPLLGTRVLP